MLRLIICKCPPTKGISAVNEYINNIIKFCIIIYLIVVFIEKIIYPFSLALNETSLNDLFVVNPRGKHQYMQLVQKR